ncbi:hypothetical protein EHI8A_053750 [Entamoeba histolytica HM-1:IMSS-B]|uniref:Uncharacterized protein n=6 Tax=Entamoeba histolytica TaxID=5759 RepID=C4LZX3_ENTH1|nr:hypothetical protein EHI_194620 [Entamoeba histolytica HM-1:IMSS]EMD43331.1 Hypothetical protein EHI5A_084260 [Entamoeba histolytica KU27]EMH74572.1 hypothetical protein EHI8A_053750 [Entamoeba histolytica HM-1:IMSS-B]EMS13780.1 hypothetical protein KM1_104430 [Entamoeba histolytica HM-3:IMSS]ENY65772.1 hypothetical protein EHI7A_053990 [Entamoeba histolytica HM-1:IMSS-A]GAT94434.1 hypothetical protein CL6EHI_194620 [Entamoeba histolytica]|eukprot:XP_654727.1 hypothetical protein EHI_194620 [Entamoeba histolytica HM-1:IMSS]
MSCYFLLFIISFISLSFAEENKKLIPDITIKNTQQYNTTFIYQINPLQLDKNSMYEIKIHSLGSIPTIYGVSLFQPKLYSTNTTFLDESNLQFKTNNNGCVLFDNKTECNPFICYVTLLYMGRTTHIEELNKGVTYFISMKKGILGLPGNVPLLILLGIICLLFAGFTTLFIIKFFTSLEKVNKTN